MKGMADLGAPQFSDKNQILIYFFIYLFRLLETFQYSTT